MQQDIEADYQDDYENVEQRCPHCQSYQDGYCTELGQSVPPTAHCDFFSSID